MKTREEVRNFLIVTQAGGRNGRVKNQVVLPQGGVAAIVAPVVKRY